MTTTRARSEAEQLLDESNLTALHVAIPAAALLIDVGVIATGFSSNTVWHLIRASGVVAYVLLTLSVMAGLLISSRSLPSGQPRTDAFEVHNFTSLLALGFVSLHLVTLLLDKYIGFGPIDLFIPFLAEYRPLSVSAGIIGLYLTAVVYGSAWLKKRIGYAAWRRLHYASFGAFVLATLHGIFAGTDGGAIWMVLIYVLAAGLVTALIVRRIAASRPSPSPSR